MPDIEARLAKIEAVVEHTQADIVEIKTDIRGIRNEFGGDIRGLRAEARSDFRLLFGALIIAVLGLAGLMARGFGWL